MLSQSPKRPTEWKHFPHDFTAFHHISWWTARSCPKPCLRWGGSYGINPRNFNLKNFQQYFSIIFHLFVIILSRSIAFSFHLKRIVTLKVLKRRLRLGLRPGPGWGGGLMMLPTPYLAGEGTPLPNLNPARRLRRPPHFSEPSDIFFCIRPCCFPFSALTLLVGRQEGHPACKKDWVLVCWWWWSDWSFARLIAPVVQLSPPPPSSFASINTG